MFVRSSLNNKLHISVIRRLILHHHIPQKVSVRADQLKHSGLCFHVRSLFAFQPMFSLPHSPVNGVIRRMRSYSSHPNTRSFFTSQHFYHAENEPEVKIKKIRTKSSTFLFDQNDEDLFEYGKSILHEITDTRKIDPKKLTRLRNTLGTILHEYHNRQNENYLLEMFQNISNHRLANTACYVVLMSFYAERNNLEKVEFYLEQLKNDKVAEISARVYIPLVNVCLSLEQYDKAMHYLKDLLTFTKKDYKETAFFPILFHCAKHLKKENQQKIRPFATAILDFIQDCGFGHLNEDMVESILYWFQRDPSQNWIVQDTVIHKSGQCKICKNYLKPPKIPKHRKPSAEEGVRILAEIASRHMGKMVKKNEYALSEMIIMLDDFKKYLDQCGPFDLVFDALNIGYAFGNGFDTSQVKQVLKTFNDKRILIIASGIMTSRKRSMKTFMRMLENKCHVYSIPSVSAVDDYFILYTVLHHKFNITLVSNDTYVDHLEQFDSQLSLDFKRWQQSQNRFIKGFSKKGYPYFQESIAYNIAMQSNDQGEWHVPVPDEKWLCIQKRK